MMHGIQRQLQQRIGWEDVPLPNHQLKTKEEVDDDDDNDNNGRKREMVLIG